MPVLEKCAHVNRNPLRIAVCLALALGTLVLFWRVTHYDFINVDDPRFVTENDQVRAGLTWAGVVWAFHSVYTEAWQPLTWLSHMLDCQIYGVDAGKHHLTSLLFHAANTLLLFLWLESLTKAAGRSALVAALFAWHPLHVESVAWICERKDVLSAFFWLLTLMAYTRYARSVTSGEWRMASQAAAASPVTRHPSLFYFAALFFFACGLMSKPMLVTLPCVLLLLDFWPLGRVQWPMADGRWQTNLRLLLEKIPFFLLVVATIAVTIQAQKAGGSLANLHGFPLGARVANAFASYLSYLTKTFWPTDLAFFYPYSFHLPLASVLGGALLLVIWTGLFLLRARQQPYLLVGWLWFVGTLVPTIGLVQFCLQARADRYTYIPSVGLFIAVVWGVSDLLGRWPSSKKFLPVLGCVALAGCVAVTSVQLGYWRNSLAASRRAIEVTENNYVAYESAARAISAMGQPEKAVPFFTEAVRLAPAWPQGQFNLGITLGGLGKTNEAIAHLQAAVKLAPNFAPGHVTMGRVLVKFGRNREALREFAEAVRLKPDFAEAQAALDALLAAHPELK